MRLDMHHLRHCLGHFEDFSSFHSKRFVYQRKPVLSHDEFLAEQSSEAARQEILDEEVFHGLRISSEHQALEIDRLGIREDIARVMKKKNKEEKTEGQQIIDESINQRLRGIIERNAEEEIENANVLSSKKWKLKGWRFVRDMRGFFMGDEVDDAAHKIRERFGEGKSIDEKKEFVAEKLWEELSSERTATGSSKAKVFLEKLINRSKATKIEVTGDNFNDFIAFVADAHISDLIAAYNAVSSGLRLKHSLFPLMSQKRQEGAFADYVDLIRLEAQEKKKRLSTTLYDPQRLQRELDKIDKSGEEGSPISTLLQEILEPDVLYDLTSNPEAQALLAHVEYVSDKKDVSGLKEMLEKIKSSLPAQKEEVLESEKANEEQEAAKEKLDPVQKIIDELSGLQTRLAEDYLKCPPILKDIGELEDRIDKAREDLSKSQDKRIDVGLAALRKELVKRTDQRSRLFERIIADERKFKSKLKQLFTLLENGQLDHALGSGTKLKELYELYDNIKAQPSSTVDSLFGKDSQPQPQEQKEKLDSKKESTPKSMQDLILGFDEADFETIKKEVEGDLLGKMKPRVKLTARQLLFKMKEKDMEAQGVTNPGQRQRFALLSTNLMIADAQNKQLYRSTNMELAERLGDTVLGSRRLARAGKWLRKKFWSSSIYEAQDVVDHVTGFDKELKMFRGMRPDITLAELRDLIERNGGISTAKLFEMISKLKEVFQSFELINSEGKVELYDNDAVTMEELIMKLQVLYEEYRTRQFFESVKDKDGSKAELILELIKENRATVEEEEKGILEQVADKFADWKQWFSKNVLKREFNDKYVAAREHIKNNKMGRKEAESYLSGEGLAGVASVLGSAYAVAEMAGTTRRAGGWTWDKLRRGSRWGYGAGTGVLGAAWRRILRPVGKWTLVKPAEYIIWKPVKWTARTAGKVVSFPFVFAGNTVKKGFRWVKS